MTLVEVLIAVTLVALLSTAMLFALRAALSSVEAIRHNAERVRKGAGAQRILEQQFANLMPVFTRCGALAPGDPGYNAAFFDGEPNVLRFVTAYSIAEAGRGQPRIVEIFPIPGENGEGVRLVVNERQYFSMYSAAALCQPPGPPTEGGGPPTVLFARPLALPSSFVLADRLESAGFGYQEISRLHPEGIWLPRWNYSAVFPTAVRVDMRPLDPNPAWLPPLPLYVRIMMDRSSNEGLE